MNEILKFENVSGKKKKVGLHNINFALEPGFIYSVIGENGAGKTTLFKYIVKEFSRYDGKITFCGKNIKDFYSDSMCRIGMISEDFHFNFKYSGLQNAQIIGRLYDNFDMDLFKSSMSDMNISLGKLYGEYSRGEKMKYQLAFAIAHNSSLYLIDEATAGMDPIFRIEFFKILRELIKDEKACVLMNSHIMSDVTKQTDYAALMKNGSLSEFVESFDVDRLIK